MVRGQPRLSGNQSSDAGSSKSSRSSTQRSHSLSQAQASSNLQAYGQAGMSRLSPHGQSSRSMTSPASFGGGLGAMGPVGPVGALGAMASGAGGAYEWEQYPSQSSGPYGGQTSGHRFDPYPSYSPRLSYTQTSIPHASAVTGVAVGSDYDYLGGQGASFPGGHEEDRRRQMQLKRSSLQSQHSAYSDADSSFQGKPSPRTPLHFHSLRLLWVYETPFNFFLPFNS